MRIVLAVALLALCTGCGIVHANRVRSNYTESLEAYKACVAAKQPAACERERAILRADERAYAAFMGGSVVVHEND